MNGIIDWSCLGIDQAHRYLVYTLYTALQYVAVFMQNIDKIIGMSAYTMLRLVSTSSAAWVTSLNYHKLGTKTNRTYCESISRLMRPKKVRSLKPKRRLDLNAAHPSCFLNQICKDLHCNVLKPRTSCWIHFRTSDESHQCFCILLFDI